ncbi:TcdA/TcdB catalytic glycosyltransferase domain-containing protein [Flavobacterium cerinum]|uniref:GT44 domain-containing protein n=1 Tax=Flavobacterium cerinum TaxID=2502784 RepID=A0ABY5IWX5_9FLAO|nr:TcdA/TcdB catalytic glycosyltransferase domain-containing protein [Flavobacterium cerinum]UUC46916.1 hypothetical protein NOX80_06880 [Flavobacterium cerinum]
MPLPPPKPVLTWERLLSEILELATNQESRGELETYCNNTFNRLKDNLDNYHNLTDHQQLGEEGFRLLIMTRDELELLKDVSMNSVDPIFENNPEAKLALVNIIEVQTLNIGENILSLGTNEVMLEDIFHLVNISYAFSRYDVGNIEAWCIAQSRKAIPSTVNFWSDRNNLMVHDLYDEIHQHVMNRATLNWRIRYPERLNLPQQLNDMEQQERELQALYDNNPTNELLHQINALHVQLLELRNTRVVYLEEFKKGIPPLEIPIQDNAYNFIKDRPVEEWDNLRIRFMQEQLNLPQNRIQMFTAKLNARRAALNVIQDILPPKYPHFASRDVSEILDSHPDLARYYKRELLLRMDYRAAHNIFSLIVLNTEGGNVLETGSLPQFNSGIKNIIDLHTKNKGGLGRNAEPFTISICDNLNTVEMAVNEMITGKKLLQTAQPLLLHYNETTAGDRQRVDAIWNDLKELPIEGFFKTIVNNPIFKDYVKHSYLSNKANFFPYQSILSSRSDSAGLQKIIDRVKEHNRQIEQILPHLSVNMTAESLIAFKNEVFSEENYEGLDDDARFFKDKEIEAIYKYRFGRFFDSRKDFDDLLSGLGIVNEGLTEYCVQQYGRGFSDFIIGIIFDGLHPQYFSHFVNDASFTHSNTFLNLPVHAEIRAVNPNVEVELETVLHFRDFFERKAMQFYELGEAHSAESIQFLPQDLLLSSYEYPEGLCLSLSLLQGMADDYLEGATIFASDISAISALQVGQLRNQLSQSDAGLYTEYSRQLRELNKVANKNFFNESTSVFQNTGSATLATLETVLSSLTFEREVRYLLTTTNHGMTLSRKGDLYTFYDSNIGYVRFDSQEKVGAFIRAHLDLKHGLGTYYGLTDATTVNISGYTNSDLWAFDNVRYFRSILSEGGAELTVDRLSSLDRENGMLSIGTARFKRTELVAMGGKYKGFAMDENTPFATADFWDQVTFDSQKLLRFIYDHEADTATINRLEALKQIGKLQTDGGIVSLADLTGGKATNHIDPLHYTILESSKQIADLYDRFSIRLKNMVDQLGLNLEEYRFKTGEVEKLADHQYKMVLVHKETGQEVPLTLDGKEFENVVSEHIATLGESSESALVLGGAGLGLMGLIRGATALRSGHGSGYDIASVVLGGKQLADAILGTVAMTVIGDTLTASGTVFSFSIEGTLANLCEQTAVRIGGTIGKLLTSVSMFLKLPLIGLNVWGLYEDVTYLNSADSGPARAVAISQLVTDSIVTALTLASFAVPEVAIPALIVGAVGMGVTAIVQNLANAHDRYYKLTEWQDRLREIANSYSPVPNTRNRNLADLSKNQLCGDVRLVLSDDRKNPHQLTYTKSCDTAIRYGHHPEKSPQEVRNAIGYGYSYTSPIGPFAREEFFDPIRSPFNIGWGLIDRVILGYGSRYQLMTQVEYISDWLLYDSRNGRASGGYWETFYTRANYNSIQQDGASCTVIGNSLDNTFITPDIVNWSDAREASYIIEQHANYQFNITTGPGNNVVVLGQTGRYLLDGGSGNNTLDLSQVQLNLNVDLDITGYQPVYMGNDRYSNCIKVAVSNFNIVRCSLSNFELHREVVVKGQSNKPNVFVLGRMSRVSVYGRGGGNTYILNKISNRSAEFSQIINLYILPPVSGNIDVSVERVHFEEYKLSDLNNVTFSLTGGVKPVLTLEGLALQLLYIDGCKVHDNTVSNVQFSTLDGFSFYYDHKLRKGVVTQIDIDKWNDSNREFYKQAFHFGLFETIYKGKFVVADEVICISTTGTFFINTKTKKAVLFANLKTKVLTIPEEFKDFAWTVSANHTVHVTVIRRYMCNAQKPLIVFEAHSLANVQNTIEMFDFGKTYTMSVSKERNSLLVHLLNRSNSNERLTILFRDIYNQDITQTLANTDVYLRRSIRNKIKISFLWELCKDFSDEESVVIPFSE